MDVRVGLQRKLSAKELMLLNCGVAELLRVPWTARRSNQSILKEISPENSLEGLMLKLKLKLQYTWCKELTQRKRPWCWERLKVGGEGDSREWEGWMASPTQWAWVWINSGSWWLDREGWCAAVHGITKSQIWLSDWTDCGLWDLSSPIRGWNQVPWSGSVEF